MAETLSERQAKLVQRNLGRVQALAKKMAMQFPTLPVEELESTANEALVHAALRYNPESGVPFPSYFFYRVRGAMIDFARRQDRGGRQYRRALKMLESTTAIMESAGDKDAIQQSHLKERVRLAQNLVQRTAAAAVLNKTIAIEDDRHGTSEDIEQTLIDKQSHAQLQQILHSLPVEDQAMIRAIYQEDTSMRSYADSLGKNVSSISRRHSRILDTLAEKLRDGSRLPEERPQQVQPQQVQPQKKEKPKSPHSQ